MLLGLGAPIFLFLLALFLFARPLLLLGDGGTCRHYLTGIYILQHHAVPITNYMSALEPNAPWVTHELLCDLIFGLPFPIFGLNWVVLTSSVAIALSFAWSYQMARMRASGLLATLVLMIVAMEACTVHWSARPHVFSYLLFLACYYQCFIASVSWRKNCIYLGAIFFLWANLHGSFPLGFMMVGMRSVGDLWEGLLSKYGSANAAAAVGVTTGDVQDLCVEKPSGPLEQGMLSPEPAPAGPPRWSFKEVVLVLVSCVVAACLNLRGASFLSYVVSYLTDPKIQFHSDEWRSLDFSLGIPAWSFLGLCFVLFISWVYARNKPRFGEFMFISALCCSSIYAMRLVPYFALAVLPAVGAQIAYFQQNKIANSLPVLKAILATDRQAGFGEQRSSRNAWVHCCLALAMALTFLFVPSFKISDMDKTRMPVAASDYLKEKRITGLGFTKDNWGSYLYWKLGEPIFLDDKTDFYSQKLIDDYVTIFMSKPGWQNVLENYKFSYVLIPTGLPLQFDLEKMPAWKEAYKDGGSVVFVPAK